MDLAAGLAAGLAVTLVVAMGCASSDPSTSPSTTTADTQVLSDYFLEYLAKASSESICQRESFLQCMGIAATDCRRDFGAAGSRCRERFSTIVPSIITTTAEQKRYERGFTQCVGHRLVLDADYTPDQIRGCAGRRP